MILAMPSIQASLEASWYTLAWPIFLILDPSAPPIAGLQSQIPHLASHTLAHRDARFCARAKSAKRRSSRNPLDATSCSHYFTNDINQSIFINWRTIYSLAPCAFPRLDLFPDFGTNHNHWNVSGGFTTSDFSSGLKAVHLRHDHIHQDDIWQMIHCHLTALFTVCRF